MTEELTITANGLRFGALAWGEPGAPLALLVHGYPDTAWTWRGVGPELARRGWRAVAPFGRGYAPTEIPASDRYLAADLADDLVALEAALGGDGRSVLIGHDWGAVATWAVLARRPDAFAAAVAMSVPPPVALFGPFPDAPRIPTLLAQARRSWYFAYNGLPFAERGLDRVIPRLWADWSPGYDASEDLAHVFAALGDAAHRRAALRYYRNNLGVGAPALFGLTPTAPVLYLHGAADGCVGAAVARAGAARLPAGSEFELLPGIGHFLQLEDPGRVAARISDYLDTRLG